MTGAELAAFCAQSAENKMRYWMGTCCYPCTKELYLRKRAQYPAHYGQSRAARYQADIAAGAMCADCVGLIKGAAWTELGAHAAKYQSGGCPDKGANGLYRWCVRQGMAHGEMAALPETPGLLLHKDGHVGVYVGGGWAVEAKSFAEGVVRTRVDGRGWTGWARLPFVDYDGDAPFLYGALRLTRAEAAELRDALSRYLEGAAQ